MDVVVAKSFTVCDATPTRSETSAPPEVATTTTLAFPEATPMVSGSPRSSLGDQLALSAPVAASASRTPDAVTWHAIPPATFPVHSVCSSATKPSKSHSPISSVASSTANTRVSRMKVTTRNVSCGASSPLFKLHTPLIPGSSAAARSWMPTPLRTTRSEPSLATPEHVTTCPWPCRSRSTTAMSTIGPRLGKVSRISTYVVLSLFSLSSATGTGCACRRTSCESPYAEPTYATPLSRYEIADAMDVSPSGSSFNETTRSPSFTSTSRCRTPAASESKTREPSASTAPCAMNGAARVATARVVVVVPTSTREDVPLTGAFPRVSASVDVDAPLT